MRKAKLLRRVGILVWVQRILGLSPYISLTFEIQGYQKVSSEALKEPGMPEGYIKDLLVKQLAWELLRADLVKITKTQVEDDYILDLETYKAQLTVKL